MGIYDRKIHTQLHQRQQEQQLNLKKDVEHNSRV